MTAMTDRTEQASEQEAWSLADTAGLITWIAVGVPMLSDVLAAKDVANFGVWLASYLLFGVLYLGSCSGFVYQLFRRWQRYEVYHLFALTLCAFGVTGFGGFYWLGSILFIIVAAFAPYTLSFRTAFVWVLAQSALLGLMFVRAGDAAEALVQLGLTLGFQLFALFTTHVALREAEARKELVAVNAELRAVQALLSESSRTAERLRIARELHDLIGHHLTALSLNLEVASHLAEGKAQAHVQTSQEIAKTLLGDVRKVVSSMREPLSLDVAGAIVAISKDIPAPRIHVEVMPGVNIDDPERAQVLLRCAQEMMTNAVKHAEAKNLWLRLEPQGDEIKLTARDDGQGAPKLQLGNGLNGMHERLEALGGGLELTPNPGTGFMLTATVPR